MSSGRGTTIAAPADCTLTIADDDGVGLGRIDMAPVAFTEATVWLRGAVDRCWRGMNDSSPPPRLDDVVLLAGDDEYLRLCDSRMTRVLEMATEASQAAVYTGDPQHATVDVQHAMFGPEPVAIDRGIAELVTLVWDLGIATTNSCENQDGAVVLTFQEAAGAEQFATAVASYARPERADAVTADDLYNRIAIELEPDDGWQRFRRRRLWNFEAAHGSDFGGLNPDEIEAGFRGSCDIAVGVAVRFPCGDLADVVEALRAVDVQRPDASP